MSLNISKGQMYKWVTHTWNTIKGECPHDCSYCYMKRWGKLNPVRLDEGELQTDLGSGNFIFVGSSCDMFADGIPYEWLIKTINHCNNFDNTYLFQTKNPKNFIDIGLAEIKEFRLCITLETNRVYPEIMRNAPDPVVRAFNFANIPIEEKYITIEPIMDFDLDSLVKMVYSCRPMQVNIGADSGNNKLPEPPSEKIKELIAELDVFTLVKEKQNLNRILTK